MVHIACVMMIRNEEKRILVSLQSIIGICSTLIIYDTGSTDTTIEKVRTFSKEHNLILRLIEGTFVDFSTSRNILLDYADSFTDIDYLLLLDCNDELKNGSLLLEEVKKLPADISGFLVKQEWWYGELNTYWNMRLVRPRHGWRYEEPVHEFLAQKENKDPRINTKLNREIVLYQDRSKDDDKSAKRFIRDYDILYQKYNSFLLLEDEKKNPRTVFYLAQTCGCLNRHSKSYQYYLERGPMKNGFWEERFVAYYRAGEIMDPHTNIKYKEKNWATALENYIKSLDVMPRVEPLLRIVEHYRNKENKYMAYIHAKMACELPFPDHCTLFVDRKAYEYKRWHLLGILAFYFQDFITGKKACDIAIEKGGQQKIDLDNLQFYITKLTIAPVVPTVPGEETIQVAPESKNNEQHQVPPVSSFNKTKFIGDKMIELRKDNQRLTKGQLHARALLEWNKLPK